MTEPLTEEQIGILQNNIEMAGKASQAMDVFMYDYLIAKKTEVFQAFENTSSEDTKRLGLIKAQSSVLNAILADIDNIIKIGKTARQELSDNEENANGS